MTQSFDQPFFLQSPTGAKLNVHHAVADGASRAILLIQHGMAEHSARYQSFAATMAARGMQVYAHDHRGHGRTVAADAPLGQFAVRDGWQKVLADAKAVRDTATERHPGLPVLIFGHSMGGLIALNVAISYPQDLNALALWNANFNAGLSGRAAQAILGIETMLKGSDVPSTIAPRLTFEAWAKAIEARRTNFDWLSHDPAVVAAYIADPLCGFLVSVSMWRDVFHLVYRGADAGNWRALPKTLPIHLLGGGQDPATDNGQAVQWLADGLTAAGFHDVTLVIERQLRHETLNETGAERPIEDFIGWTERALAAEQHRRNAS